MRLYLFVFFLFCFCFCVHAAVERDLVAVITWNYPLSSNNTSQESIAAATKLRDVKSGVTYTGSLSSTRSVGSFYFPEFTLPKGYFYVEGFWNFVKTFPSGETYTDNLETSFVLYGDSYYLSPSPVAYRDYSLSGSSWWKTSNFRSGSNALSFTYQLGTRDRGWDWSVEPGVYYGSSCWGVAYLWNVTNATSTDFESPAAGTGWSTPSAPIAEDGQPYLGSDNPTGVPDLPPVGGGSTDPENPGTGGGGTGGGGTGGGVTITGNTNVTGTGTIEDGQININLQQDITLDVPPPIEVPEAPSAADLQVDNPIKKISDKLRPNINLPSGGTFHYPSFIIPLPGRDGITISLGDGLSNSTISRSVRLIQGLCNAIGYFLITLVTFKAILKLFRKNS